MEIQFDCECGAEVSDFVRGDDAEMTIRTVCEACDALYAVTITPIQ